MGNVTGTVAAKFAFFPPEPPTYDVCREDDGRVVLSGVTADKNVDVHILETKGGNKIVATLWKHPFAMFTFLYSHGNAADLGQMHDLFIELRAHLRVNIMRFFSLHFISLVKSFASNHKRPFSLLCVFSFALHVWNGKVPLWTWFFVFVFMF